MENPCKGCIIITVCCNICEKAKPYFMSLTTVDKNFDWREYERRREEHFRKEYDAIRMVDTPESREKFRQRYNMADNESYGDIISRNEEKSRKNDPKFKKKISKLNMDNDEYLRTIIAEEREKQFNRKRLREGKYGGFKRTNTGTEILRKIKHFCSLNFKNKADNKG